MDSLWTYMPIYIAAALFLVGSIYQRRHPDSERARKILSWLLIVAVLLCAGTVIVNMGRSILAGATGLIVPLVLIVALMLLTMVMGFASLRPRPETTAAAEIDGRKYSTRTVIMLAIIVALMAYGVGFGAGYWMSQLNPDLVDMPLVLGIVGVLVVAACLVPWGVVKLRAAARRHAVANGHPSSPEVIEHVMAKVTAARLNDAVSDYGINPFRPLLLGGAAILVVLATPALMQLIVSQVGEIPTDDGEISPEPLPLDFTALQVLAFAFAAVLAWFLLVSYFLVPVLRGVRTEYLLAALSDEDRLRWQAKLRAARTAPHRFPSRLTDPTRSIRVLTITESGTVRLERMPAGDLLEEHSEPLLPAEHPTNFDHDDDEDLSFADLKLNEQKIVRVLEALYDRPDGREFDVFEHEYSRVLHVVEVGGDDYRDFPEDLAQELTTAS